MPKPVLQSLILADHVYEDKLTGKRIIAGVFNRIIRGVRVIKQMGPPMPQPQPPPQFNPPPSPPMTPYYTPQPPTAQPQHQPATPSQAAPPASQPPAPMYTPPPSAPPSSQPGFEAPGPATHAAPPAPAIPDSELPPAAPPGSQPGFVAPGPATHQPAPAAPQPSYAPQNPAPHPAPHQPAPHQPAHPNDPNFYGQSNQIVQPGQPATPVPHQPPAAPYQQPPTPPQHHPQHPQQLGPPGTPLAPGQRVLEIPPTGLQSGSPFAYLSLTEIRGPNAFVLELVNLSDDSQLFRSDLRVDCPDPLLTVELTVPLPPIAPPQAGIYALQLLHNHEILGSLRIIVEDAAQ